MNKTAIVTGGVRRLGRYISYYLADNGYNLALIYNSSSQQEIFQTEQYIKQKNIRYKFYKCDIRDLPELKNTIETIGNDFEKADLLVNNSGIIRNIQFEELTPEIYEDVMNVNLRAVLFASQFSLPYLRKAEEPSIIVIASLGGLQNWTSYFPYSLSKTAVVKLTKMMAKSLAPQIRVNAIAPGTIIIEGEEGGTPGKSPIEKIPLRKYGKPEDITNAVDYLIKAKYVTGEVIAVVGGRTLN